MITNNKVLHTTLNEAVDKIQKLKIQGATNIALFSLRILKSLASQFKNYAQLHLATAQLALARPNEPLTRNTLSMLLTDLKDDLNPDLLTQKINHYLNLLTTNKTRIAQYAAQLIQNQSAYISHCHSTSLESAFITAHKQNKKFTVYQTETRPLYQGRTTATNLHKAGIDVKLIVDDTAAWLVSVYDDLVDIKAVFVGADVISQDGWVINKVGTFGISLSAFYTHIPVYVVASLLKYQPVKGQKIKVEIRPASEVWFKHPKGLSILNFAFDKTPPKFIKAFITEAGLVSPDSIEQTVQRVYPNLVDKFSQPK